MRAKLMLSCATVAVCALVVGLFADEERKAETPEARGLIQSVDAENGTLVIRGVREKCPP